MTFSVIFRRDTSANWAMLGADWVPRMDEILRIEEPDHPDHGRFKVGDNVTPYAALPFTDRLPLRARIYR